MTVPILVVFDYSVEESLKTGYSLIVKHPDWDTKHS